jgi:hypothetical protein
LRSATWKGLGDGLLGVSFGDAGLVLCNTSAARPHNLIDCREAFRAALGSSWRGYQFAFYQVGKIVPKNRRALRTWSLLTQSALATRGGEQLALSGIASFYLRWECSIISSGLGDRT